MLTPQVFAQGEKWLQGWNCRKSYVIGDTADLDAENQTRIIVHNGFGIDSGENVYTSGLSNPDFSDIRFTMDDGLTPLNSLQEPQTLSPIENSSQTVAEGAYNAFGFAVQTRNDIIVYFYRQGTSHANDKGIIVMRQYTISSGNWGPISNVFSDNDYDCRNVGGGIIGNNVFLFFNRWNYTAGKFLDDGYIKSVDLSCTSWSNYKPFYSGWGSPYGHLVRKGMTSTWYMPFYSRNGTNNELRLLRSTDEGTTWGFGATVYSGPARYCEPSVEWCGSNRMILLSRNDAGGPLHQFISTDGGDTWVDVGDTNLGGSRVNIPWIINYGSDFLHVSWTDRDLNRQMVSQVSINQVFTSPKAYPAGIVLYDLGIRTLCGYCSLVQLSDKSVFYVLADEKNANEAAMIDGLYDVKTVFWVKLPNNMTNSARIFVYYGLSSATTQTSLSSTIQSQSSINASESTANAKSIPSNSTLPSPSPSPPNEQNSAPQSNPHPTQVAMWIFSAVLVTVALFTLVLKKVKLPSR